MRSALAIYLLLEHAMVLLDDTAPDLGDRLRDVMDPVWYAMSANERAWLSRRGSRPDAGAASADVN